MSGPMLDRWRDVSVIEGRHTPVEVMEDARHERTVLCSRCQEVWPCDARRMVEHLSALLDHEAQR